MMLGALGKINPLIAATIHNAATIGVVINSGSFSTKNSLLRRKNAVLITNNLYIFTLEELVC